ncbi:site-2 protease family protein [bacterium]|nr:site-2 protease family protein [bacterium]|tara:strand:- start:2003 stop:2716 length:714 start_codon:yes stop_codon:yes gene_type:complete
MIIMIVIMLIISVCIHEWAHGYAAYLLGDKTALHLNRLTLNPLRHIDLVGSLVVPLLLVLSGTQFVFGWAKPVPVNSHSFKHPKRDMLFVAMAGPFINVLLAIVGVIILKALFYTSFLGSLSDHFATFCLAFVYLNIVLAVFNLLPIPPLDGSYLIISILPAKYHGFIHKYSIFGLLVVACLLSFTYFQVWFEMSIKMIVKFLLSFNLFTIFYYAIFLLFFSFYNIRYKGYFMDIIL